ncbi:hypothetical protein DPMN_185554 [Dreissena polymorpha]|uniref:Uncharacterized protein n=1 Tax=Dreissena polymorpha TaxID=45954 RepID=A0A9D4I8H9_DREPO|nr:hypothetical protein DPMN_185554 [Dreissena polymorpha]
MTDFQAHICAGARQLPQNRSRWVQHKVLSNWGAFRRTAWRGTWNRNACDQAEGHCIRVIDGKTGWRLHEILTDGGSTGDQPHKCYLRNYIRKDQQQTKNNEFFTVTAAGVLKVDTGKTLVQKTTEKYTMVLPATETLTLDLPQTQSPWAHAGTLQ